MNTENQTQHSSLYYVIPAQVFEDERLEKSELVFYALLSGLANSKGYAYATNEHYAYRMKVDTRTIKRWIDRLEFYGYIRREVKKNGMYWDRKIYITHSNSKNSYEGTPMSPSEGHPCPDRGDTHVPKVSKAISIKERKYIKEKVTMTEEEFEKLCSTLGKEKALRWIEKLNDYMISKGVRYANHYRTVLNWVKREAESGKVQIGSNRNKNLALLEKIRLAFPRHPDIEHGNTYIDFKCFGPMGYIKIDDNGFEERVLNNLRKMNLRLES